jgi:hypothetical protein
MSSKSRKLPTDLYQQLVADLPRVTSRFLNKTLLVPSGCIEWQGYVTKTGYGQYTLFCSLTQRAHRVAWMLFRGAIPDGLFVCHKCDNRKCVNIDHLFLGTVLDNNRDTRNKGRHARNPQGEASHLAKLTEHDVWCIREELAAGKPQIQLAKEFHVSQHAIFKIKHRVTWKHLDDLPAGHIPLDPIVNFESLTYTS